MTDRYRYKVGAADDRGQCLVIIERKHEYRWELVETASLGPGLTYDQMIEWALDRCQDHAYRIALMDLVDVWHEVDIQRPTIP